MDAAIKDVYLCQCEVKLTLRKYSYEHALGVDITHFAAYWPGRATQANCQLGVSIQYCVCSCVLK